MLKRVILTIVSIFGLLLAIVVASNIMGSIQSSAFREIGINVVARRRFIITFDLFYTFFISALMLNRHLRELAKIRKFNEVGIRLGYLIAAALLVGSIHIYPIFWANVLYHIFPNSFRHTFSGPFVQIMHFAFWFSLFHAFKRKPDKNVKDDQTPPNES